MAGVKKHSVIVSGHKTSVSLEAAFWDEISAIAGTRGQSVSQLICDVDRARDGNLSSALRLFVLEDLRRQLGAADPRALSSQMETI